MKTKKNKNDLKMNMTSKMKINPKIKISSKKENNLKSKDDMKTVMDYIAPPHTAVAVIF